MLDFFAFAAETAQAQAAEIRGERLQDDSRTKGEISRIGADLLAENARLRQANAALLEALQRADEELREVAEAFDLNCYRRLGPKLRAALALAAAPSAEDERQRMEAETRRMDWEERQAASRAEERAARWERVWSAAVAIYVQMATAGVQGNAAWAALEEAEALVKEWERRKNADA